MRLIATVSVLVLALCGCDGPVTTSTPRPKNVPEDNTAVNARDRQAANKTPIDQNENQKDINLTADIRKQVVDSKMSSDAKNVKIITQDGRVTLRGPVKTADEKKQIEDIANRVAGDSHVDSQLEVQTQP